MCSNGYHSTPVTTNTISMTKQAIVVIVVSKLNVYKVFLFLFLCITNLPIGQNQEGEPEDLIVLFGIHQLDSLKKIKDSNILSKTNNVIYTTGTDLKVKKIKATIINVINNTFLVSTMVV